MVRDKKAYDKRYHAAARALQRLHPEEQERIKQEQKKAAVARAAARKGERNKSRKEYWRNRTEANYKRVMESLIKQGRIEEMEMLTKRRKAGIKGHLKKAQRRNEDEHRQGKRDNDKKRRPLDSRSASVRGDMQKM